MGVLPFAGSQEVDGPSGPGDRLGQPGLEAAPEVEHHVGVQDGVDVVGGQLHVVGLGARRREVADPHPLAAHPGRHLPQAGEAGDDVGAGPLGGRRAASGSDEGEHRQDQGPQPENHAAGL